jgi:hypothetical protein
MEVILAIALFADEPLQEGKYSAMAGAVGVVLAAMFQGIKEIIIARSKNSEEVNKWAASEQEKAIKHLAAQEVLHQAEIKELKEQAVQGRKNYEECARWRILVENWFKWVRKPLHDAGIEIPEFETEGSKEHTPLPTTRGTGGV